jgi:hypothetical protein
MVQTIRFSAQWALPVTIGVCLLALFVCARPVSAITALPTPNPKPGSYGLEATKTQPAPTVAASITTPGSGASFANSPITVSGICPNDLLVEVQNNGVMVGSVLCKNGSFSLQVSLFAGVNELSAIVYDDLERAGPVSNIVTVNYTDTHFTSFGSLITLTSSYARRSAPAGSSLEWPLQLTGGTGPYAFNIDWGDGSKPELKSQALLGVVTIAHPYKKAGIYQVNITVTDVNGVSAFLQVIAVSSGKVGDASGAAGSSNSGNSSTPTTAKVLWVPSAISLGLLLPSFWLGRLSQITSLRNKMLKERDSVKEQ